MIILCWVHFCQLEGQKIQISQKSWTKLIYYDYPPDYKDKSELPIFDGWDLTVSLTVYLFGWFTAVDSLLYGIK